MKRYIVTVSYPGGRTVMCRPFGTVGWKSERYYLQDYPDNMGEAVCWASDIWARFGIGSGAYMSVYSIDTDTGRGWIPESFWHYRNGGSEWESLTKRAGFRFAAEVVAIVHSTGSVTICGS